MRFSTRELAVAYAIVAYKASYATAEARAQTTLSNLTKHATFRNAADTFTNDNPEYFI